MSLIPSPIYLQTIALEERNIICPAIDLINEIKDNIDNCFVANILLFKEKSCDNTLTYDNINQTINEIINPSFNTIINNIYAINVLFNTSYEYQQNLSNQNSFFINYYNTLNTILTQADIIINNLLKSRIPIVSSEFQNLLSNFNQYDLPHINIGKLDNLLDETNKFIASSDDLKKSILDFIQELLDLQANACSNM
jgi:hypothetical protein